MFDQATFDQQVNRLIRNGLQREAESTLLKAYVELKTANNMDHLEYITKRLAQFYSMPQSEDRVKAEHYFTECERLSPKAHTRLQTATFYFYVMEDFPRTIAKVDEMVLLKGAGSSASYYSALTLKGQALLKLGMIDNAGQVLRELLSMIKANPPKFPFGDEINFLEATIRYELLRAMSLEILRLITPKIRSQEYAERAKSLLETKLE